MWPPRSLARASFSSTSRTTPREKSCTCAILHVKRYASLVWFDHFSNLTILQRLRFLRFSSNLTQITLSFNILVLFYSPRSLHARIQFCIIKGENWIFRCDPRLKHWISWNRSQSHFLQIFCSTIFTQSLPAFIKSGIYFTFRKIASDMVFRLPFL